MIGRFARRVALAALLAVLFPVPGWASERFIDYLYIDANEGGSSGGHVGLLVDDDVFHFEYRRPGMLVLRRETFDEFRHQYAALENRTIEVSRIPVSEETFRLVRQRFRHRYFVQRRQLEVLDTLGTERQILEQMLQGRVELDGAGFFLDEERVLDTYGANFLTERVEALRRRLSTLGPPEVPEHPADISGDETPAAAYGFSRRYRDTLTALTALDVLATARPLRSEVTITAAANELSLSADDARRLRKLSDTLATSLVRLLDSPRPDWGFPLLLGMARLAALERTRESQQWVFLDVFPRNAEVIERARVARRPELIGAVLGDAYAALEEARGRLASRPRGDQTFGEGEFSDLEAAGNLVAEIRRAVDEGRDLRVPHHLLWPARPGVRQTVLAPSSTALAAGLVAAREREEAYAHALERLYPYHIVTRNCVSEILGELDVALLGNRVAADASLTFVPALSTLVVNERYGVSAVFRIPSHRRAGLARLYQDQNPVQVFLRESNTITSTLYWRNSRDSVFVFFTDDVVVMRPVFGAANLVAGVAASAVGLATAPFDRGKLLRAGLRGAVFSLPELFFQNIRKGSFEYVGQRQPLTAHAP
ncbi:MAG: hypothetical protein DMD78_26625 [Candidatus Rokuibacteriota bacterium]|nr:MAG: hypothetical protein DMD78_26625 [Candidatus Rokubacteria bacterium]